MNHSSDFLLVSASPRRSELLRLLGARFDVHDADVDESRLPNEPAEDYVLRLARAKALAGLPIAPAGRPTLGADTVVLLDDDILGKPTSREHAASMLARLSGRDHEVLSGVAVASDQGQVDTRLDRTRVVFEDIPPAWIQAYCQGDEPMDKAGAYAIQGQAAQWVRRIEGNYFSVMGLPLSDAAALLRGAGVELKVR
jgi:septum formation protein